MNSTQITCPHCGQRLHSVRVGARLSPLKARIFDAIERCDGIRSRDLIERLALDMTVNTLRVHIWQINDAFARQGIAIRIISRRRRFWKIGPPKAK